MNPSATGSTPRTMTIAAPGSSASSARTDASLTGDDDIDAGGAIAHREARTDPIAFRNSGPPLN